MKKLKLSTETIELTIYKGISYTPAQIEECRDWLKELTFADEIDFDELTQIEVLAGVNRHYDGGLAAFEFSY